MAFVDVRLSSSATVEVSDEDTAPGFINFVISMSGKDSASTVSSQSTDDESVVSK